MKLQNLGTLKNQSNGNITYQTFCLKFNILKKILNLLKIKKNINLFKGR